MAIQMRRGANSDFNPSKMLPGEIAVTTDGTRKVYAAFKANDVKELASKEDVQGLINGFTSVVDREIAEAEQRIESKGQQVLETIPDLYEEVSARADEAVRTKADAIVCSASGVNPIAKDSSNDYLRNLKLFGKTTQGEHPSPDNPQPLESNGKWGNLLENKAESKSLNGIDYVVNKDKTVSAVGNASAYAFLDLNDDIKLENGEYVLSGGHPDFTLQVYAVKTDETVEYIAYNYGGNTEFTVDNTNVKQFQCRLYPNNNINVNAVLKPQITRKKDNITSYRPYTGQLEIESRVYGGNLFDYDTWKTVGITKGIAVFKDNGVELTADSNGDAYTNWSATEAILVKIPCAVGEKYILSWEHSGANGYVYIFPNGLTTDMVGVNATDLLLEYTPTDGVTFFTFRVGVQSANATATYKNIRINVNEVLPWSEYKQPQSHISLVGDGLKGNPLGTTIPDIIKNSPIHMSGVYWDEKTQQYYIGDTKKDVNVQRIKSKVLNDKTEFIESGNKQFGVNLPDMIKSSFDKPIVLCDSFLYNANSYGTSETGISANDGVLHIRCLEVDGLDAFKAMLAENPITVQYILAEPIITPLSASELASYKALKSNYKVTSVMNDCGAFMEVQYNADMETWINNAIDSRIAKALAQYKEE